MNGAPGVLLPLVKTSAALAVVLALLLGVLWVLRRWSGQPAGGRATALVRLVASQPVGPKKAVSLVRVPGLLLVLGVTADGIRPLAQIDDPSLLEEVDQMPSAGVARFGDHLARLTRRPSDPA